MNRIAGLVGVILGKWTTAPFEETDEVAANFQIFSPGAFRVGAEMRKQLFKCFPG